MKWNDVPNGTKFKLLQDLYLVQDLKAEYQFYTKKEIDEYVTQVAEIGNVFVYDADEEELRGNTLAVELGLAVDGNSEIELALWEQLNESSDTNNVVD